MSHKKIGPIGSAFLTFIGYRQTDKQTNRQTDKPNLYIDIFIIRNKTRKRQYLTYDWSDKGFNGIVINRALPSLHRGLFEITLTVPLI